MDSDYLQNNNNQINMNDNSYLQNLNQNSLMNPNLYDQNGYLKNTSNTNQNEINNDYYNNHSNNYFQNNQNYNQKYANNQNNQNNQNYPNNQNNPNNQIYQNNHIYISNQNYPTNQNYPNNQNYQNNHTFINNQNYIGNQNYPNYQNNQNYINNQNYPNYPNNQENQHNQNIPQNNVKEDEKDSDMKISNEGQTPQGNEINLNKQENEEIQNYYKDLEEEKKKDQEIISDLTKKSTHIYENKEYLDNTFSYKDFKKVPTTYIDNEGKKNITYMTCVLQCLANIEPIAKYYLKNKLNCAKNMDKCPFNYAFSRIISNMYSFPEEQERQFYQTFKIDEFKKLFIEINKTFRGESTKDASHFLNYLIETIVREQETKNTPNSSDLGYNDFGQYYKNVIDKHESIFFNCFNWIKKETRICLDDHQTTVYNNFLTYQLDIDSYINKLITNSNNLQNLTFKIHIEDWLKSEKLVDNTLYNMNCNKCKRKIRKIQQKSIYISPNYFIFLTGLRESSRRSNFNLEKLNNESEKFIFKIDEKIYLSDVIENKKSHMKYSLIGLISYNFDETDAKKISYVSYFKSPIDQNWYCYNETEFKKINLGKVLQSFENESLLPCILFYKHD